MIFLVCQLPQVLVAMKMVDKVNFDQGELSVELKEVSSNLRDDHRVLIERINPPNVPGK